MCNGCPIKMFDRKTKRVVSVYSMNGRTATIFDGSMAVKQNGYGWTEIKKSRLVPIEYVTQDGRYVSNAQARNAKDRIHMVSAKWVTDDGKIFDTSDYDDVKMCYNDAVLHVLNNC